MQGMVARESRAEVKEEEYKVHVKRRESKGRLREKYENSSTRLSLRIGPTG